MQSESWGGGASDVEVSGGLRLWFAEVSQAWMKRAGGSLITLQSHPPLHRKWLRLSLFPILNSM